VLEVEVQFEADRLIADFSLLIQQLRISELPFQIQNPIHMIVEDRHDFICEASGFNDFNVIRVSRGAIVGTAGIASAWLRLYREVAASMPADGRVVDLTLPELVETAGHIKANVEAILTGTPAVAPLDWGEDVLSLRLVSGMWLAIVLHELAHLRREDGRDGHAEELECDRLACEILLPDVKTSIVDLLLGPAAGFMFLLIRGIHRPRAPRTHPHPTNRIKHALLPRLRGAPDALWAFVGFVASLHLQAVSIEAVHEHESFRSSFEHCISKAPELIERE